MEENYVKVLNKEKVLEFKKNIFSSYENSEIILQNISNYNIISKIYINNYTHFKCQPNIVILNKNATKKIKVIIDDEKYNVCESDVFLIISHPITDEEILNTKDNKKLNEYFKNNSFKEKGQKIFLIGYKNEKEKSKNVKNDELINKIKELEKQVYDQKRIKEKNIKKINDKNSEKLSHEVNKNSNIMLYMCISLLILSGAFILYRFFKK